MNLDYRIIPNYPKDGVNFIDMDYVYRNQLRPICNELIQNLYPVDGIVAIGSRGWVTASVISYETGTPIFLVRDESKGMKDWIYTEKFNNEYDERRMGISPSIIGCKSVAIVDDLIATGSTIFSVSNLIKSLGIEVKQILSTIKLSEFNPNFDSPLYYIKEISCEDY